MAGTGLKEGVGRFGVEGFGVWILGWDRDGLDGSGQINPAGVWAVLPLTVRPSALNLKCQPYLILEWFEFLLECWWLVKLGD